MCSVIRRTARVRRPCHTGTADCHLHTAIVPYSNIKCSNGAVEVLPGGILSLEFLVNAWEFAIATGRHVVVSEPVSEYVLGVAGKVITAEARNYARCAEPTALDSFPFALRSTDRHASAN